MTGLWFMLFSFLEPECLVLDAGQSDFADFQMPSFMAACSISFLKLVSHPVTAQQLCIQWSAP